MQLFWHKPWPRKVPLLKTPVAEIHGTDLSSRFSLNSLSELSNETSCVVKNNWYRYQNAYEFSLYYFYLENFKIPVLLQWVKSCRNAPAVPLLYRRQNTYFADFFPLFFRVQIWNDEIYSAKKCQLHIPSLFLILFFLF